VDGKRAGEHASPSREHAAGYMSPIRTRAEGHASPTGRTRIEGYLSLTRTQSNGYISPQLPAGWPPSPTRARGQDYISPVRTRAEPAAAYSSRAEGAAEGQGVSPRRSP
jgi:hypothetical protein